MEYEVAESDTAEAVGSGDVPVLATPRLIGWLEAATMQSAAEFIATGQTSVGTAVRIEHRRATRVGGKVVVTAEAQTPVRGRRLTFLVRAVDESGQLVATGEIERAIVDREQFLTATPSLEDGV